MPIARLSVAEQNLNFSYHNCCTPVRRMTGSVTKSIVHVNDDVSFVANALRWAGHCTHISTTFFGYPASVLIVASSNAQYEVPLKKYVFSKTKNTPSRDRNIGMNTVPQNRKPLIAIFTSRPNFFS